MDYPSIFLCLVLTWTLTHILISKITKTIPSNQQIRLPPGPPTLPILGNLFSLRRNPRISLTKLANKYGPLMFLQLGQVPTVIISTASMAKKALHKNDLSVSSRMVINGTRALNHHENSLVWLSITSPQWRFLRKISNIHIFWSTKLDMSQSLRMEKVEELIDYVQNRSKVGRMVDIGEVAFTTTLNLLSNTFFSMDLVDHDSDLGSEFRGSISDLMDELGKPNFADYFPVLQMIDPQGIQKQLSLRFRKMFGLFGNIIDQRLKGKRNLRNLTYPKFFISCWRKKKERKRSRREGKKKEGIKKENASYLFRKEEKMFARFEDILFLQDMFVVGTETISITLEWAMTELLRNSNKLKKTQEELEKIIGKGKSIEESNITRLPYLQAIVKETFRLLE
ncbi:geraniol 8-hydroxylase-like [Amaranthus tricolor]|uniref:geraniol 8-hydroxylase-like n=1 Tax=Amaranthus tricolor TaxID=29722 RepID=UPI0025864402|nr:geraniol 8-hydroxylase-like [Amaranthus tricolor]